jgi:hypothetical protein
MKHLLRILLTSTLLLATAPTVHAQGPGSTTPGFSGRLQGGAFFMQTNSQLSTADSESRTEDLDGPADTYESFRGSHPFTCATSLKAGPPSISAIRSRSGKGSSWPQGSASRRPPARWMPP